MWRLVIIVAVGSLFVSGTVGCKVSRPGKTEAAVVQWAERTITIGGSHDRNPIPPTEENIEAGKRIFAYYCVVCHGRDGQRTGVPFANSMSPPIPSLASAGTQKYSDGQLKWIITNGISPSGMPASKGILSDEDMWTMVVFLRHLPPAGSLGEPSAYTGEEYDK